jgi:hypothetical protein
MRSATSRRPSFTGDGGGVFSSAGQGEANEWSFFSSAGNKEAGPLLTLLLQLDCIGIFILFMRLGRRCVYSGSAILALVLTMTWVLYPVFKGLEAAESRFHYNDKGHHSPKSARRALT